MSVGEDQKHRKWSEQSTLWKHFCWYAAFETDGPISEPTACSVSYLLKQFGQSFRVEIPSLSLLFTNDIQSLSTVCIKTASQ